MTSSNKLVTSLFLIAHFQIYAQPTNSEITAKINSIREQFHNAGMAVGVFYQGQVVYENGFGYQDHETKKPITPNSLFMIGSTTKAFTATAAGALVQENLLEWDTKVKDLIPEFKLQDEIATHEATLRDLLLHRTGLPRHDLVWYSRDGIPYQEMFKILPHLESSAKFREKWQYQNIMYMVAGLMTARTINSTWEDVVRDKILKPLEMNSTYFHTHDVEKLNNTAMPHQFQLEGQAEKFQKIPMRSVDTLAPAGAMHSNIHDIMKRI